jgi:CRISPR-associated protein Cmr4
MYHKAYGIIETLAPLHVGASAGEETGNLNLIFRDQFTQTGIIPGSSIRGRFRNDMRTGENGGWKLANQWYGHESEADEEQKAKADEEKTKDRTTEALVKFEYASLVWLPVFCPGQPVVWVTCPRLLKRYKQISGMTDEVPNYEPGAALSTLERKYLFFNLGFLNLKSEPKLSQWIPQGIKSELDKLVMVHDKDISMIHEMALYRQTRVALEKEQKKVAGTSFFNVEALPEGSILAFPIALKKTKEESQSWQHFIENAGLTNNKGEVKEKELYFGGLESIGFGRTRVTVGKNELAEDSK